VNLKELLESKLPAVMVQKLGEVTLSKLVEIGLEDEIGNEIKSALLSIDEARNTPSIVAANKDIWHKEAMKGYYDSDDALLAEHLYLLGDQKPENTKDTKKAVLTKYKEKVEGAKLELEDLKQKQRDGLLDSDSKALIKDAQDRLEAIKLTHVSKEEVEGTRRELGATRKELEKINAIALRDQVLTLAIKSGTLAEATINSEMVDILVSESVSRYLGKTTFGADNVLGELVLNTQTRQLELKQKGQDLSIVKDGKILTPSDLIKDAIVEYKLNKKGDDAPPKPFTPANASTTQNRFKVNFADLV
jgi:hypothetical protein